MEKDLMLVLLDVSLEKARIGLVIYLLKELIKSSILSLQEIASSNKLH
eukprot:CAMPEP_0197007124 /NCGR_PEP_ID=MMETSP1380-20130617/39134_1 /TAXON_ID=5936 /ORGANISM="Euplotes crassus, Strain CT5" /LENGTH=47 /DNA_ID= /DNA_START= /DNA_END= /DNA_ORIENTATION=